MKIPHIAACAATLLAAAVAGDARAETFATCTGFIASVPTTISTQGTWCFDGDLASALSSGALITIATNNVTIDCNDFKLGGLAAGPATATVGIAAVNRNNVTVRNCNIRGFARAIDFPDLNSAGHRIVDNRFDGNTVNAIAMQGTGHTIRRNILVDTGGSTIGDVTYAMFLGGDFDVQDNTIDGVTPAAVPAPVGSIGIVMLGSTNSVVRDNRVRNVFGGEGFAYGIGTALSTFATIEGNYVTTGSSSGSLAGIICTSESIVAGNRVHDFGVLTGCPDDGGNIVKPLP